MSQELKDTGDFLEVPVSQRLFFDDLVVGELNEDMGMDLSEVPDGDVVELSTAHLDERSG